MKTPFLFQAAAWSVALLMSAGCGKPEAKLADHVTEMGAIMDSNADKPKAGAEALREYVQKNLPDMMKQVGEMMAELDKIEDPSARAKRAKEMIEPIETAVKAAQAKAMAFGLKAMGDEETQKYLEGIGESYMKMAGELGDSVAMLKMLGGRKRDRKHRPERLDESEDKPKSDTPKPDADEAE